MNQQLRHLQASTRRAFLAQSGINVGALGLASLLGDEVTARVSTPTSRPRAKAIIYLFMAGGPSQLELFDQKPLLGKMSGEKPPQSFLEGKRFAFLTGEERLLGPRRPFGIYGDSGAVLSNLLPHLRNVVDDLCFLKGMTTDVFNHGPAKLFLQTGSPQPGRPSMGSWITYGLGSEAHNLPGFVVLQSGPRGPRAGSALWASGFLPTTHQGVPFRSEGDAILNLRSPKHYDREGQRAFTDVVADLNQQRHDVIGDPEIRTRIAAYEMAYRMQISAPELMDLSSESPAVLDMYGAEPGKASFANNALMARRLVQRGVRFVQLYHTSWDQHGAKQSLEKELPLRCQQVDQASAALIKDLKQHGMLDETLVVWGGEFGRTPMGQQNEPSGRDHHVDAFTLWLAGGGIKPGITYGQTDDLGLSVVDQQVHVHDLQATLLHLMGIDHTQLTYRFQGRDFRLTDVHGAIVKDILA